MDKPSIVSPTGLFQNVRIGHSAKFELPATLHGFKRLDVISGKPLVATFTRPAVEIRISAVQEICAANAETFNSVADRQYQWWDDDMLKEPLEPLGEFE